MALYHQALLINNIDLEHKLNGQASKQGRVEWAILYTQAISAQCSTAYGSMAETFKAQLLSSQ